MQSGHAERKPREHGSREQAVEPVQCAPRTRTRPAREARTRPMDSGPREGTKEDQGRGSRALRGRGALGVRSAVNCSTGATREGVATTTAWMTARGDETAAGSGEAISSPQVTALRDACPSGARGSRGRCSDPAGASVSQAVRCRQRRAAEWAMGGCSRKSTHHDCTAPGACDTRVLISALGGLPAPVGLAWLALLCGCSEQSVALASYSARRLLRPLQQH